LMSIRRPFRDMYDSEWTGDAPDWTPAQSISDLDAAANPESTNESRYTELAYVRPLTSIDFSEFIPGAVKTPTVYKLRELPSNIAKKIGSEGFPLHGWFYIERKEIESDIPLMYNFKLKGPKADLLEQRGQFGEETRYCHQAIQKPWDRDSENGTYARPAASIKTYLESMPWQRSDEDKPVNATPVFAAGQSIFPADLTPKTAKLKGSLLTPEVAAQLCTQVRNSVLTGGTFLAVVPFDREQAFTSLMNFAFVDLQMIRNWSQYESAVSLHLLGFPGVSIFRMSPSALLSTYPSLRDTAIMTAWKIAVSNGQSPDKPLNGKSYLDCAFEQLLELFGNSYWTINDAAFWNSSYDEEKPNSNFEQIKLIGSARGNLATLFTGVLHGENGLFSLNNVTDDGMRSDATILFPKGMVETAKDVFNASTGLTASSPRMVTAMAKWKNIDKVSKLWELYLAGISDIMAISDNPMTNQKVVPIKAPLHVRCRIAYVNFHTVGVKSLFIPGCTNRPMAYEYTLHYGKTTPVAVNFGASFLAGAPGVTTDEFGVPTLEVEPQLPSPTPLKSFLNASKGSSDPNGVGFSHKNANLFWGLYDRTFPMVQGPKKKDLYIEYLTRMTTVSSSDAGVIFDAITTMKRILRGFGEDVSSPDIDPLSRWTRTRRHQHNPSSTTFLNVDEKHMMFIQAIHQFKGAIDGRDYDVPSPDKALVLNPKFADKYPKAVLAPGQDIMRSQAIRNNVQLSLPVKRTSLLKVRQDPGVKGADGTLGAEPSQVKAVRKIEEDGSSKMIYQTGPMEVVVVPATAEMPSKLPSEIADIKSLSMTRGQSMFSRDGLYLGTQTTGVTVMSQPIGETAGIDALPSGAELITIGGDRANKGKLVFRVSGNLPKRIDIEIDDHSVDRSFFEVYSEFKSD